MKRELAALLLAVTALAIGSRLAPAADEKVADVAVTTPELHVPKCGDFEVDGTGSAEAWKKAAWVDLNRRGKGPLEYRTRFRMLYSDTGVYVLFEGADGRLTATMQEDFLDLWNEDVFECFFWPDERHPVYFEYEISPLGFELPILVPNLEGRFLGWRPWHYDGPRRIKKAVHISGGEQKSGATITGWQAEVFIPYELLKPLQNVPPKSGSRWRANFYRVDYDDPGSTGWDWARVGPSFHDVRNFGTLIFD